MKDQGRVIICRSVAAGLKPGSRTGYACSICQEPLQLTPAGVETIRDYPTSIVLCNECGLLYVHMIEAREGFERLEMSPEAQSQLADGNKSPLASWFRKRA